MRLVKEFKISIPVKIHIIVDHLEDYFNLNGGKPLGDTSDQTVEAAHQHVNKRLMESGYWNKAVESVGHGLSLLKGILHINGYNAKLQVKKNKTLSYCRISKSSHNSYFC